MPSWFFQDALAVDFDTAIPADVGKQKANVCPRHWYVDATFRCVRCQSDFLFDAQEQRFWYETLGFYVGSLPKHCCACRAEVRRLKALQTAYEQEIAATLLRDAPMDSKRRLVDFLDALEKEGVALSDRMQSDRVVLMQQLARGGS